MSENWNAFYTAEGKDRFFKGIFFIATELSTLAAAWVPALPEFTVSEVARP